MNISSRCILCLLNKEEAGIRACLDEHQKAEYLKDVMRIMLEQTRRYNALDFRSDSSATATCSKKSSGLCENKNVFQYHPAGNGADAEKCH